MASQHPSDQYKATRESVDVESLAQELSRYLKITAEDTEFLSHHASHRDELFAELYKQFDVKSGPFSANQFVQVGGNPDAHLVPANAEIERLTPPKTLEDRVARLHVASAALVVFNQYKVGYALLDHPDLERQLQQRKTQIMDEWRKTEFVRLFPESAANAPGPSATPTALASLPGPPLSSSESSAGASDSSAPRPVSDDEAAQFLRDPGTMLGKRFVCSPPEDALYSLGFEDRGLWEVVSCRVHMDEGVVDREYMVLTEEDPDYPLPMGESQVRDMLRYSTFAV
ncbi:hypothetical protein GSI_14231 [Ganoderma sinense ZZ0214-1]|uniref:Uncharacterized protein n=1 Tax=Ganoderma sinense ZZ0214-1 TaxID=1077348 RepID=A0A2G8RSJ2_9APHY|nr:hypothetical protein GSI_14231 [Ganoderma sinense ZZ0214-1]